MCFIKSNMCSLSQNFCEVTFHISRLLFDTSSYSNLVMQLKRALEDFFYQKYHQDINEKLVKFIRNLFVKVLKNFDSTVHRRLHMIPICNLSSIKNWKLSSAFSCEITSVFNQLPHACMHDREMCMNAIQCIKLQVEIELKKRHH